MNTREKQFLGVLRWRDVHHGGDSAGVARRLPAHPIDGLAMVFCEVARARERDTYDALVADLVLTAVAAPGSRDRTEVQVEAGLLLSVPEDVTAAYFHQEGEHLVIRAGWAMKDGHDAPDVGFVNAVLHPVGRARWALQFMSEATRGGGKRGGTLFASRDPATFAGVEAVTLGVPWGSAHGELLLMYRFEAPALGHVAGRAVDAALTT